MAQIISDETVDALAIRAALGNNGGTWADHYTEDQKEHWRKFVRDFEKAVAEELVEAAGRSIHGLK